MNWLRDSYLGASVNALVNGMLQVGAVALQPLEPFTWSSGWKSPIYCDNRLILGYPMLRDLVLDGFAEIIQRDFPGTELVVGTATAGIPHAAMLSDRLSLPNAYVRSSAKAHGKGKQIEGYVRPGIRAVVIEDTLSTGGSAYQAVRALQAEGVEVSAVLTILSYDFDVARGQAEDVGVPAYRLVPYGQLIQHAEAMGQVRKQDVETLLKWREAPDKYGQA